jgi:translation initiation factor 1 (eIF-1/SUI1)
VVVEKKKPKKKKGNDGPPMITIQITSRAKRKFVTVVTGLDAYGETTSCIWAERKEEGKRNSPWHTRLTERVITKLTSPPIVAGVKLKDAAKLFANRFACGSSVSTTPTDVHQVDIQGDVRMEIVDFILQKFPQITAGTSHAKEVIWQLRNEIS